MDGILKSVVGVVELVENQVIISTLRSYCAELQNALITVITIQVYTVPLYLALEYMQQNYM